MSARAFAGWEMYATSIKAKHHTVAIQGNGTGQPTQIEGPGMTLNRTAVGVIDITWDQLPGQYIGLVSRSFEAATPSQLKGYSAVCTRFDPTTFKVTLNITDATNTLADLTSTQFLTLSFLFKQSK